MEEPVRILVVNCSMNEDGNLAALIAHLASQLNEAGSVEVDLVELSSLDIRPCTQCNWCMTSQLEGRYCAIDDGMSGLYDRITDASAMIIASPVHFGRLSGTAADYIDRLRVFVHGRLTAGSLRNKVGGALVVSWFRNCGCETTIQSINVAFHMLGMVIASPPYSTGGAAAFSSIAGTGETTRGNRHLVNEDGPGIRSARELANRTVELVRLLESGWNDEV